ncbi:DUF1461 domain-containing protein [Candidatus Woesearchaeota archaeon]|nr:DUF1461 domain-containing protein [Candidatus Woesearchaeota archaeon]
MGFLTISKILMVLILPFLLFLAVLNSAAFSDSFYQEKFSEYGVYDSVSKADFLHKKVVEFVKGSNNELPKDFNEREWRHLLDVRNAIGFSTIVLYALVALFIALLTISALILKANKLILGFVGKVLVFGGVLTIAIAAILFFLINSNFPSAFESFHRVFFKQGTYAFDPAKEVIVNLYPEQLFTDLGIKISKIAGIASATIVSLGILLLLKSKKQKNKNK